MGSDSEVVGEMLEQTKLATAENLKSEGDQGEQSHVEACMTKDSVVIADADDKKSMARSAGLGIGTLESPSQMSDGKPIDSAASNANDKGTVKGGVTLTPGNLQPSAGVPEGMESGNQQAGSKEQASLSPGNQSKESTLETQQQEATGREGQEVKAPGAPNASMQAGLETPKQTVETIAQETAKDFETEQSSGQTSDTMNSVPALEQSTQGRPQNSGSPGSSCDQAQPPALAMVSATPSTEGAKPAVMEFTQCQGSVSQSIPASQQQPKSSGLLPQQVTQPPSSQHQQQVFQQVPQHVQGLKQSFGPQSVVSNAVPGQHATQQQQQQHPQQQHHHQQQVAHPQQQQIQQQQPYPQQGQVMVQQNQLQTTSTQGQQITMHSQQMMMQHPQHVMQQQGMHQPQVSMMHQQQQMPTQHMQMQQQRIMLQQQVQHHHQQQAVMQSPRSQMMRGAVQQQHIGDMTLPMQTSMQAQGVFQQQGYQHGESLYMVGAPATATSPPPAMIIQQAPAAMVSPGFAPGDFGSWAPFTTAQWHELEQQAMVFKYLVAGAPVPQELVDSMRMSLSASTASQQGHMISFGQPMRVAQVDPEPFRCRRTDGKKWRCSREVVYDQKYCERHMHRGRNRARKINDKSTPGSSLVSADEQSELHKSASQGGASELAPDEPGAAKLDRSESIVVVSSGGPPPLALPPSAHNGAQAAAPQQPQQPQQQQQPQYLMHPLHAQGHRATMSAANQQGQPPSQARLQQPMQVFSGGQGQGPAGVQPQYNGNVVQQSRPGSMPTHQVQQQWQQSQPGAVGQHGQTQNQGAVPNQQPVQDVGTVPAQNSVQLQQGVQGGMVPQPAMQAQMGPQQQYQQPVQQAFSSQAQQAPGGFAPQFGTQAVQQPLHQGQYQRTQGSTYMAQGQSTLQSAPAMYQMGPNGSKGGQPYVITGQGHPQLQQQGHPVAQVCGFQGNPQQYGQYPQGQIHQTTQQPGTAGYVTQQQQQQQVYQQPTIQQSQALVRSESQYSSQSSFGGTGEPGTSQHQNQHQQQPQQLQLQQQQQPQQQQQQQYYRPGQVMQQTYQSSGYVNQRQQGGMGIPGQYGGPVQANAQYQAQKQQPCGTPGSADGKVPLLRVRSMMPASGGGNGPSPPPSHPGQLTRTPSHTQPYGQASAQHAPGAVTSQSAQQQPMQQQHSRGPTQSKATQTVRWGGSGQASISPTTMQPWKAGPAMQAQNDWAMARPGQHTVTQNSTGMVAYHATAPMQFHPGYAGKMELASSVPRKAGGESMMMDQSADGNGSSAISPNCVLQGQHCHSDSSSAESPMGPLSMGENHGSVATRYHGMQGQASAEGSMASSQANN